MKYFRHLFLPGLLLAALSARAQTNTIYYNGQLPLYMPDGYNGSISLLVSGADHDTLGINGQGVCRVFLSLEHEYIGDLMVTLTSPGGQSIPLIGPIGFFGGTDFSTWDVAFTRCADVAQPEPGYSHTWSNEQGWGLNGVFSGSYYPYQGCFENLTGPVNGAWTLTITDGLALDAGALNGFGIEFCNSAGATGMGCQANAGTLTHSDIYYCQGGNQPPPQPPAYTNISQAPPSDAYDYTYAFGRASDDVLMGYEAHADLSTLDTGTYRIYGVSYPEDADSLLPIPDGVLTLSQIRNSLNSSIPPFCGDVSFSSIKAIVRPPAQDTILYASTCNGVPVYFFGIHYYNSGTYTRTITQGYCQFSATLVLQTSFPVTYTIRDTICAGTCSEVPGFDSPCISGLYIRTFPAVAPDVCDTTIRLQLTVLNPVAEITATATTLDCTIHSIVLSSGPSSNGLKTWKNLNTGATSFASNYTITTPDTYVLTCQKGSGELLCTAYDTIQITSEPNQIALSVPDVVLPCGQTTTHFLAQATGAGLVYNWTGPGGFTGTTNHPLVSVPGTYHVTVSNQQGCQGTATAHLVAETPPFSVAATTDSITCGHPATLFAVTNAFSPFFHWSGPGMESFLPNPQVSTPATYAVTVSSPSTLCTATAQVNVVSLQVYPFLHLVQRIHPTVGQNNGSIEMSTGGAPGPFAFSWIKDGQVVATTEDIYGVGAGVYSYQVQAANGCSKTALFTLLNSLPNDDEFNSQSWELAPNPSSGFFNLRWKVGAPAGTHLRVYAGSGRLLQEWNVPEGAETLDIDLSNAPAGLYFLEMRNGAERAWQKMVVR